MPHVTLERLFAAYGQYLRAKVQLMELASWGPATTDSFRKDIATYEAMEADYILQMKEARKRSSDEFKAKLEAFDQSQKQR